jgi:2-aminoadipate transaminase
VGSFSKVLGTGLRIGWLHLPSELVEVFKAAKGPSDMCAPVPSQLLVYKILKQGLFKEIRDRAVRTYKEKRDLMLQAIEKYLPGIKHTHPIAGMFVFLWLPPNISGWKLAEELLEKRGVAAIPGAPFFTDESGLNTLRLNFSMAPKDLIEEGVKAIAELLA